MYPNGLFLTDQERSYAINGHFCLGKKQKQKSPEECYHNMTVWIGTSHIVYTWRAM